MNTNTGNLGLWTPDAVKIHTYIQVASGFCLNVQYESLLIQKASSYKKTIN